MLSGEAAKCPSKCPSDEVERRYRSGTGARTVVHAGAGRHIAEDAGHFSTKGIPLQGNLNRLTLRKIKSRKPECRHAPHTAACQVSAGIMPELKLIRL